ncbi:acetylornithine deacetylase [Hypericibacter terrae]|uniref:Acetylornithine deacetylase n=1 Tax=Hypericibacter terrae TaxID=2602015 RepID=A0A5J6MSM7_9PROT|nr:acetylornithine deacetylase [Hypericibacter terrae]QEX19685.1 acetylornithine deacetylase [Hypericibacter terrae]
MSARRYSPMEMIETLIGFPTVSADSNLNLIGFVRDYLSGRGIESRLTYDESKRKANLFATIGPDRPGGVVLSGHTDVVPVAGQPWESDPFTLTRRGDRIYGRGTSDMKSFIAVALALVPEFQKAGLRRPIHLALSYDEEVGCFGVPHMLRDIAANLPLPAMAIIGEPTSMQLANRHKGDLVFRTRFTGRDGHSSAPQRGLNAIFSAAEFLTFLSRLAAELRDEGPQDESFDPPYTTVNVGQIDGGTAFNIVARRCEIIWEFRPLPSVAPETIVARVRNFVETELLPRMRQAAEEAEVETATLVALPPLMPEPDSPAEALIHALTGVNEAIGVAFGTEAGHFQQTGIPAVVFGPGSIQQAHKPDEFIEIAQVEACVGFMRKLAAWAASSPP